MIRINLTSVLVDEQAKALAFYTEAVGFVKKADIPVGEARWLTVVSPASPDIELLLEPAGIGPAKAYQKALFEAGIPLTAFATDDIEREHQRMSALGVVFRKPPAKMGPVTVVLFEDTCGNVIQLVEHAPAQP